MKTSQLILLSAFILMVAGSCRKQAWLGVRGKGELINETKSLSDFDAMSVSTDAEVVYTQDSVYKVEIKAQKNILEVLDVKVQGRELKIETKRPLLKHDPIQIIVHTPKLVSVTMSGSGRFVADQVLSSDQLDLTISGSGQITFATVNVKQLNVDISGSGNVNIEAGVCETQYDHISGSGNIHTENMPATTCTCKLSGSGNVYVKAGETMRVEISGSGSVCYKGRPAISSEISGSGKIISIN